MDYEYSIEFITLWMKAVNSNQKFLDMYHLWSWTMIAWLGDYLAPIFLFNQERVLGSQHNGTKPICRSSSHPPDASSVNREDTKHREAPWTYYTLYLPSHPFLVASKKYRWSAYYYTSFTLCLIPEYPEGWWLGRGGRSRKDVDFNYSNF